MKLIKLTQGKFAQVDNEDFEFLITFRWYAVRDRKGFYAMTWNKGNHISMHRFLFGLRKGDKHMVDHRDSDGLNNTRENIRLCTNSENNRNSRRYSNNTSGYKGVNWHNQLNKWRAEIRVNGKAIQLGTFLRKEDAYKAYCEGAKMHHGEFAHV